MVAIGVPEEIVVLVLPVRVAMSVPAGAAEVAAEAAASIVEGNRKRDGKGKGGAVDREEEHVC